MGYLLDLAFWVLVTWYAIGAVFLARFLGGPIYMTPGLVAVSVLMGLGCGWLSRGIYNRKIGRMMECFLFQTLVLFLMGGVIHVGLRRYGGM